MTLCPRNTMCVCVCGGGNSLMVWVCMFVHKNELLPYSANTLSNIKKNKRVHPPVNMIWRVYPRMQAYRCWDRAIWRIPVDWSPHPHPHTRTRVVRVHTVWLLSRTLTSSIVLVNPSIYVWILLRATSSLKSILHSAGFWKSSITWSSHAGLVLGSF